jgi:hypothetical protein
MARAGALGNRFIQRGGLIEVWALIDSAQTNIEKIAKDFFIIS